MGDIKPKIMGCFENKLKNNCKTSYAVCAETDLEYPAFSSHSGEECGNVNEALIDIYGILGDIKTETDLSGIESECLTAPSNPTVKNYLQLIADTICAMQEQITALQQENTTQAIQIADLQTNTCP